MESLAPFSISTFRQTNHKRLQVGDEVFLVSQFGAISRRKEIICEKTYRKGPRGVIPITYFEYTNSFFFKGELLEVNAFIGVAYGPLGLRVKFDAKYNDKVIGNYRIIHSHIGAGAVGNWPIFEAHQWTLLFDLDVDVKQNSDSFFRIEYFEHLSLR
jgi:hypothetical protein